jgi:aspartyl-tRNA(Asn)/glutamyl-tRNA(Gln) amidotransferase subunit A
VASGLAPLALATDGGGSTRIPAAANGVVGLKQTVGAVPHSQSPDPFGCYTFVTPTTRTVRDTALMMQALAGPHACDPWSYAPPDDYATVRAPERLDGLRIALLPRLGNAVVAREVLDALDRTARQLEALGARVEPLDEAFDPIEPLWRVINHTTWRARFLPLLEGHRDVMTPTLVRQVESAESYSAQDLMQAAFRRGELFRRAQGWLERFDALLMPTLARSALPIGSNLFDPVEIDGTVLPEVRAAWFPYTMPWSLTGHPAITLPTALDRDGLPLAVQLVGRFRDDASLLALAAALEAARGWNARLATG